MSEQAQITPVELATDGRTTEPNSGASPLFDAASKTPEVSGADGSLIPGVDDVMVVKAGTAKILRPVGGGVKLVAKPPETPRPAPPPLVSSFDAETEVMQTTMRKRKTSEASGTPPGRTESSISLTSTDIFKEETHFEVTRAAHDGKKKTTLVGSVSASVKKVLGFGKKRESSEEPEESVVHWTPPTQQDSELSSDESDELDYSNRRSSLYGYDSMVATIQGPTKTRTGLVNSLNRAIDNSFGTAITFLGGGKIRCGGSYVRVAWEVGDNAPQYAKFNEHGELKTFVINKYTRFDAKRAKYIVLRRGDTFDAGEEWVTFHSSTHRRILLERRYGEKIHFLRLEGAAEFDGLAVFAIRHDVDPLDPKFVEKHVTFRPPVSERAWIENILSQNKRAGRAAEIRFYELPLDWLEDKDSSPELKELIASQCPTRITEPVYFPTEEKMGDYYLAGLRRTRQEISCELDSLGEDEDLRRELENMQKVCLGLIHKLSTADTCDARREVLQLLKAAYSDTTEDEVLSRSDKATKPIVPAAKYSEAFHAEKQSSDQYADYDFEGTSFHYKITANFGSYRVLTANELRLDGLSAHGQILLNAIAARAVDCPVHCEHVTFEYEHTTSVRSITTNQQRPEHGFNQFGQFWQERVSYHGTYRGVWFRGDDPGVRVMNNQLMAEFLHASCRPVSLYHTNVINMIQPIDFHGKSVYFDSFDLEEGRPRQTACFRYGVTNPLSGLARLYPPNLEGVVNRFPVRFENDRPFVTITSAGKSETFPYEIPWIVDRFDPDKDPQTNLESMLSFRKDQSGLERLLGESAKLVGEAAERVSVTSEAKKPPTAKHEVSLTPVVQSKPRKASNETAKPSTSSGTKSLPTSEEAENTLAWKTNPAETKREQAILQKKETEPEPPSVDHSVVDQLLRDRPKWLSTIRQESSRVQSWDELCKKSRIEGKARTDLESDLFDFARKKRTKRTGIEKISKSVWKFFFALDARQVERNLTPYDHRRKGAVPSEFTVDYE